MSIIDTINTSSSQPSFVCRCATESDMDLLAHALAPLLQAGDVVTLDGELGAGKTRFVQGVARGLGVAGEVTSPTFTIHVVYEGRLPLNHFDVYRLESEEELDDIGYWEVLEGDGASFVEWARKFPDALPQDFVEMELSVADGSARSVSVRAHGRRSAELLCQWCGNLVSE